MPHRQPLPPLAFALALALLAAAPAAAQDLRPVPGPVRHAGTYDLATATWTRGDRAARARGAADTFYSNDAPSGYFTGVIGPTGTAAGGRLIDEGGVPGTANPGPFASAPDRDFYRIEGMTIAYCDLDPTPGSAGWLIDFYDSYVPGASPTTTPGTSLALVNLPSNGCWIVDVTFDACLQADGGPASPGFDMNAALDSFGVGMVYIGSGAAAAGPILAGDPVNTDPTYVPGGLPRDGSGTYYGAASACGGGSTGYLNDDGYLLQPTPGGPGTYVGGGYMPGAAPCSPATGPYGGILLELRGTRACDPAGPISVAGCTGATNSTGAAGTIEAFGNLDAAQDDCRLVATDLPPGQFGIFATGLAPAAAPLPAGDGFLCIDPLAQGGVGRFTAPNQLRDTGAAGRAELDTGAGDWSVFALPSAQGPVTPLYGATSYFQFWHRDIVGAGSNLTGSCAVTWL